MCKQTLKEKNAAKIKMVYTETWKKFYLKVQTKYVYMYD